ncbi:MAG TPA: hypothetical protein VEF76_03015 [Patescibacteria group bacterium]|nr:hypothetical protein [Patescibacteria group bacterium]
MAFGRDYSDSNAYFIAGGKTLALIQKYEYERENAVEIIKGIAQEYGAARADSNSEGAFFTFNAPVNHPLFGDARPLGKNGVAGWIYKVQDTEEGRALTARLAEIPDFDLTHTQFAKRLTGREQTDTNPDHLRNPEGYGGASDRRETAASFQKYGDTYVVSVPRVMRGIFNEAAAKLSAENHVPMAAGYTYEWFTPPDSVQIPYSKVVELREKAQGDQLAPRTVTRPIAAFSERKR